MAILDDIAEAGWTYPTRTIASGSASSPTNGLEDITAAIWEYINRELTSASGPGGEVNGVFTAEPRVIGLFENEV